MCGIAGFTSFKTAVPDPDGLLVRMVAALTHRGPDGHGHFVAPPIALGHRRLSLVDSAGGAQPMATPDRRAHLVFNGELYNFIELRQAREARGERFATRSDAEVLLRELAADPVAALPRFDGMFAIAFWNADRQELLLARDRFGIKPLVYAVCGGELVFASEIRPLLFHPLVSRELDRSAIGRYFAYGHVPAPGTLCRDIRKLEPGHFLVFGPRGICHHAPFGELPVRRSSAPASTPAECADRVRAHLRTAVRRQLRSDVPVGVLLSGGVDSSALAALAAQESSPPLHTFSLGFDESSFDESRQARVMARHCGSVHHHATLDARQAVDLLPQALACLDEPLADPSLLPTFCVARFARQTVKAVIGGEGGDELFGGYPAFQAQRLMGAYLRLPPVGQALVARLADRLPASERYADAASLLKLFLRGRAEPSPAGRFLVWMGAGGSAAVAALFSRALRAELGDDDPFAELAALAPAAADPFDFLQAVALKRYLQDHVLAKVDRAGMAHGLEVRVPFLDPALVDCARQIPPGHHLGPLRGKRILKLAIRDLVPPAILRRRKAGFMFPLEAWLAGPFQNALRDLCAESLLAKQDLFDPVRVHRLMHDHFARRRNHGRLLWSLLVFQHWMARHESRTA